MKDELFKDLMEVVDGSFEIHNGILHVTDATKFAQKVGKLAELSALGSGSQKGLAQYVIRLAAADLGINPASINDLYLARGRGEVPFTFTVPAINLRVLAYDAARAVFRAARGMDAAAIIFEIARSEMNYTDQRPSEYSASVLAAAIAEGYRGPVFIQGDHFQVSAKRFNADQNAELDALKALMRDAVAAGFFNIDVDTSTLVDLTYADIPAQQRLNVETSAHLTAFIRSIEPMGVTVSVGGEIGEVGGHNSTEEELNAYLGGYDAELERVAPGAVGLSKISIQTGTSHGGVVLPDGSIAKVDVDFDTLKRLSRVACRKYGLGGTVQHGASTLPEDAFSRFVEYEANEVHLATNFMTMFFDHIPAALKEEMYAYLRENFAGERKAGMTDEQFYYKTRKNVIGVFKAKSWGLPQAVKDDLDTAWENQFRKLFRMLGLQGTRKVVEQFIHPVVIHPDPRNYLGEAAGDGDVSDLAD